MLVPSSATPTGHPSAALPGPGGNATAEAGRTAPSTVRPAAPRAADPVPLTGLAACVEDAKAAAQSPRPAPPDPTFFSSLRTRLLLALPRLPTPYRTSVGQPLLARLEALGPGGFARLLATDPARQGNARLLLDVAQAVLQRAEGYQSRSTSAFQEVVSDLYEGFLSAEDRKGVKPPDHGVNPPVVRWGPPEAGPYTWPATATGSLGVGAAVVSLPVGNATAGLLAWPALAHETAGHDVLSADEGLREELSRAVGRQLRAAGLPASVATYWSERIDEAAADVLGVLNMGPAAAAGMVAYFRALNGAWRGTAALRSAGREDDPHPADVARGWLAAETVRLLSFSGAGRWADRLTAEVDRDAGQVRLGDTVVPAAVARASAALVARAVARTRLRALEGRALGAIQDWTDRDEAVVATLREGGARYRRGTYAAHAVAAAVYDALSGAVTPARAQERMLSTLSEMHARNPDWSTRRDAHIAA